MAAGDAGWPPIKNAAWRVTFPVLDADGDLVTGATSPDSERSIDAGTFADCSNEAVEIATNSGMYYLDLNASEMNGDTIAIIVKSGNGKTTPIVVYPVSGGFNELVTDHVQTQSDIADLSTKVDSDALLADADHDKTQSDIADVEIMLDSETVVIVDRVASDAVLIAAALATKVESDLVETAATLAADHDKTQSDVADLSTKVDSDAVLAGADHDKTQSDIALLDAPISDIESSLVIVKSDLIVLDDAVSDVESSLVIVKSDLVVIEPVASDLAASAGVLVTGLAEAGTLSTTQMTTDLAEATNDHYNGRLITWTSGVLVGQQTDITDYVGVNGLLTYTAVTEAPGAGDAFVIQ